MASNVKKYILTSLTLGLIAASGALLIAGANMITRGPIADNEQKAINKGIATIFADGATGTDTPLPEGVSYTYVKTYYAVKDQNDSSLGYALRTEGYNNYGKVSLIIGFNKDCIYKGLSIISNEQSYASQLKSGYLNKIQDGSKTIDDVDVHCGATYGATLVRKMVIEAGDAVKDIKAKEQTNG